MSTDTPAGTVEVWDLARVKPYENNAWKHPADQVERLVKSIRQFGFINPLICTPDGEMIAGHGRLAALRVLGKKTAPVLVVSGLTPEQVRAYRLADNELAKLGDWDLDKLRVELQALDDADFDLDVVGFDEVELRKIIDDVPDFIGQEKVIDGAVRTNNNLGKMSDNQRKEPDAVQRIALHWGGIQVVLDAGLYRRAFEYVEAHAPDRRAGVVKLLLAGLSHLPPVSDPAPESATTAATSTPATPTRGA